VAAVGALAAPQASAVPGAESLRTTRAFHNTFRDARVSKRCCERRASAPLTHARLRTTARAPSRRPARFPSVMQLGVAQRRSAKRKPGYP
jgi:hypothetical protein